MSRIHRGGREHAARADDWLITYADMITLLLCFFVIFYVILSRTNVEQAPRAWTVARPARRPTQAPVSQLLPSVTQRAPASGGLEEFDFSKVMPSPVVTNAPAESDAKPAALSSGASTNDLTGDRLTAFEMNGSAFFASGSASPNEAGKSFLRTVAAQLQSNRYDDYQIVVEGHTDDSPIDTGQFSSNWELSIARAASVVHFLLDQGILPNKIRAEGYADTHPEVPNRDIHGNAIPENQAQNRRVIIKLEKIETAN